MEKCDIVWDVWSNVLVCGIVWNAESNVLDVGEMCNDVELYKIPDSCDEVDTGTLWIESSLLPLGYISGATSLNDEDIRASWNFGADIDEVKDTGDANDLDCNEGVGCTGTIDDKNEEGDTVGIGDIDFSEYIDGVKYTDGIKWIDDVEDIEDIGSIAIDALSAI